jgi:hypothetical protein
MATSQFDDEAFATEIGAVLYNCGNEMSKRESANTAEEFLEVMAWSNLGRLRNEIGTAIQIAMREIGRPDYPLDKARHLADASMKVFLRNVAEGVII